MGPVANSRRMAAIEALVADAREAGANLAAGGEREVHTGALFYRPTVVTQVPLTARAMNEEPFGPMALINSFRTAEDALEQANRLPYGLAAFAFTEKCPPSTLPSRNIECGLLGINTLMLKRGRCAVRRREGVRPRLRRWSRRTRVISCDQDRTSGLMSQVIRIVVRGFEQPILEVDQDRIPQVSLGKYEVVLVIARVRPIEGDDQFAAGNLGFK